MDRGSVDEFFQDNFAVDAYLSKCTQKSDLLTLRKDLKKYGHELYQTMINILKMETEDIINLAENLNNLNSKVDQLSAPMSQLYEEIKKLYVSINEAQTSFKKHLHNLENISHEKDILNLKIGIFGSSKYINHIISSWDQDQDITILEHAVNDFSFQFLYSNEIGVQGLDSEVFTTVSELLNILNKVFENALKLNNEDVILRCLNMYLNLNKQKEAENCVRKNIVKPLLENIFTPKNLDEQEQNINVLYTQALEIIKVDLGILFTVLKKNLDVTGFRFLFNGFWIEVDKQLFENLPNITAPGNPDLFQRRYKDTWFFLDHIKKLSLDHNSDFKESFETHMKRFNLPVYFEIRFQEIAAKFENVVLYESENLDDFKFQETFRLKISFSVWESINCCFSEKVFLLQLADQFVKLTMMLIRRYLNYFEEHLKNWKDFVEKVTQETSERWLIYALGDFDSLKLLIAFSAESVQAFDNTVFNVIPSNMRHPLLQFLEINRNLLSSYSAKLQNRLVELKVEQCVIFLQQVTSIPRLYRRTNRCVPKDPSQYIIDALLPISQLYENYHMVSSKISHFLKLLVERLSKQYIALVQEVLHSMCKTEESLRRLKSRSLNANEEANSSSSDVVSDETKIREQIKLDVGYFIKTTKPYLDISSEENIKRLISDSQCVE